MSLKILSPFGPKMAKLSLPKSLVAKINQEVDKIITSNILSKKYNYSKKLAGEVEQEIELPNLFVNKFIKKFNLESRVSYISTGGGAMIEYLVGKKLPAIVALL